MPTETFISFTELQELAENYSQEDGSIVQWLRDTEIIEADEVVKRGVGTLNTNLDPRRISVRYLMALALDSDKLGPSSPLEFTEVLAFDLKGSKKKDIVSELLSTLGQRPPDYASDS